MAPRDRAARQAEHGGATTKPVRILVVLVALGALLLAPEATAQKPRSSRSPPTARLVKGGKAIAVQVTVTGPTGAEVLEAFLYVTGRQPGQVASFQPICDDTPHTFVVQAQAVGFGYHIGQAQVSAFVLLTSGASTSRFRPSSSPPSDIAAAPGGAGQGDGLVVA